MFHTQNLYNSNYYIIIILSTIPVWLKFLRKYLDKFNLTNKLYDMNEN